MQQYTIFLMDNFLLVSRILNTRLLSVGVVLILLVWEPNIDLVVHRLHFHNKFVLLFRGCGSTLNGWCTWVELSLSIGSRCFLFGIHFLSDEAVFYHLVDIFLFLCAVLEVWVLNFVSLLRLFVIASRIYVVKLHLLLLCQCPLLIRTFQLSSTVKSHAIEHVIAILRLFSLVNRAIVWAFQ